jgi:hypothetical protein
MLNDTPRHGAARRDKSVSVAHQQHRQAARATHMFRLGGGHLSNDEQ